VAAILDHIDGILVFRSPAKRGTTYDQHTDDQLQEADPRRL
jgi:hypothetical protein